MTKKVSARFDRHVDVDIPPTETRRIRPYPYLRVDRLLADPLDLVEVAVALECLLVFLTSPAGQTDANCTAIDSFLCLGEFERPELPDVFQEILADMAGALHDTVSDPEIAANFDSTPEQLLVRIRRITA